MAGEVLARLPDARVLDREPGRVYFHASGPVRSLLELRSVNHVNLVTAIYEAVPPGREGLDVLERIAAGLDLSAAVAASRQIEPWGGPAPRFRVTAHRTGAQEYRSPEIAAAVGAGIVERYGWQVNLTDHDLEVVAYLSADRLVLGARLTRDGSLHRRNRVATGVTTLKASVAYSLVWLARPEGATTLVDPLCGTGAIPVEAALGWPHLRCLGGDISSGDLEIARRNAAHAQAPVGLTRWDARRLPLEDASVDRVVTDMPFGRRVGSHASNRHLYPGALREIRRVLAPGGRAVVLTTEKRLFTRLVDRLPGLRLIERWPIVLSNLRPSVYVLERR